MPSGDAARVCAMNGTWLSPDVSTCRGVTFALAQEVILICVVNLPSQAVVIFSGFPVDFGATNYRCSFRSICG